MHIAYLTLAVLLCAQCDEGSDSDEAEGEISVFVKTHIARIDSLEGAGAVDSGRLLLRELVNHVDTTGFASDRAYISGRLGRHYLYFRGETDTAQDYLIMQRDLLESTIVNDISQLIRNYIHLSFLHVKRLELPFARSYAMMAYQLAEKSMPVDSVIMSEACIALGHVYWYGLEEERAEALRYYHLARQFLPDVKNNQPLHNKILIGLINIFNNAKEPDSATYYLDLYFDYNQNNSKALAEYYRLYGICHYLTGDFAQSANALEKAVNEYRKQVLQDPYSSVDAFLVLSAAYQYDQKYTNALTNIDSALMHKFGSVQDLVAFQTDISSIGIYAGRAEILADSAMLYKDTVLAMNVLQMYKSLDTLRRYFTKLDIDTYLHQQFYDNYVYWKPMEVNAFLYSQSRSEEALHRIYDLITAYKAQGFNRDKILNQLFHSPYGDNPNFQRFIRNDLELETVTHMKDYWRINNLKRQRQEIIWEIAQDIPEVMDQIVNTKNISSTELLRYTLEHENAVINYYIGNTYYNARKIYVLVAVNGKFKLQILDQSLEILNLTDTLYQMHKLAASGSFDLDTTLYYMTSYLLYTKLFKETREKLEGVTDLVIIPDQKLHMLSFEALVTDDPGTFRDPGQIISNSHYLIEDLNIVYAYSPNDLQEEPDQDQRSYPLEMLVMGYSSRETLDDISDSIPELNSSYREMEVIKMLKGANQGKYFSGYNCTKSNFLRYAGEAEIIHISTHGAYDPEDRTSSVLYLRNKKGIEKLYPHEIRYRDIQPRLIVLSACDSGAGKASNEEGMFSIGRTFQAFGAEEVISALWPLSGNASAQFCELLYRNLLQQQDAATALRNAKLKMSLKHSRYAMPGYWSAFVMHY